MDFDTLKGHDILQRLLTLFTFSPYTIVYRESIVFVQIFEFEFLVDLPVLVLPESKKVVLE
jgi:hypothetical protein